jgi:hypothetical protein
VKINNHPGARRRQNTRKRKASRHATLKKWATIALRGIYIAARKSRIPRSKTFGRLLRTMTA